MALNREVVEEIPGIFARVYPPASLVRMYEAVGGPGPVTAGPLFEALAQPFERHRDVVISKDRVGAEVRAGEAFSNQA